MQIGGSGKLFDFLDDQIVIIPNMKVQILSYCMPLTVPAAGCRAQQKVISYALGNRCRQVQRKSQRDTEREHPT